MGSTRRRSSGLALLAAAIGLPLPALACDPTLVACALENFDGPFSNPRRDEIYDHLGYGLLGNAVLGAMVHASRPAPPDAWPMRAAGHHRHYRRLAHGGSGAGPR